VRAQETVAAVDAERLVRLAVDLVSIPSPTGDERAMGERVRDELEDMGLQVQWQEVEDGRPNVVGLWET
jgi:acetylornithine deacetylase/succinyl-diaminopimelate desuccinylase-like protein